MKTALAIAIAAAAAWSQEADSGFEVRTNVTAAATVSPQLEQAPRSGIPAVTGVRVLMYPTWKLNNRWTISGAVQTYTRPYFVEQFRTQGFGVKADVLQLHLSYSRYWKNNSLVIRAGQLSSAFGSFLLRYDDKDNALTDMPLSYGYYYKSVSTLGLTGVQTDLTLGKVDARAQFVSSSATNRRGILDSDQYGNWAGGLGYTIVQGLRIGVSAYRGPYLHRQHPYFRPGEVAPRMLPATGVGFDAEWVKGYWIARAEWQSFRRTYRAMPSFKQEASYVEVRRLLHPRWFVAARAGYLSQRVGAASEAYDFAVGFRPNHRQLVKVGYQVPRGGGAQGREVFTVQLVTTLPTFSMSRNSN